PHATPLFVPINRDTLVQLRAKFKGDASKENNAAMLLHSSLPTKGWELRLIFNGWCRRSIWATLETPAVSTTPTISTAPPTISAVEIYCRSLSTTIFLSSTLRASSAFRFSSFTFSNSSRVISSSARQRPFKAARSCLSANFCATFLRANLCIQFWRVFLRKFRDMVEKHVILFGESPHTLLQKNHYIYIRRNLGDNLVCAYKTFPKNDVPRVMLHDVLTGIAKTDGKFEILVWRSRIPPYHEYVLGCEAQAQLHMTHKRK
ncbi:hypothetical protein ABZP36_024594, partial [Zizania latifolia]